MTDNSADFRITKQRQVILERLKYSKSHPTAEELYAIVRRFLPRISLGTVYRNLEQLSEMQLIKTISLPNEPRRFDNEVFPHNHIHCRSCGRVDDIDVDFTFPVENNSTKLAGYHMISYNITVHGICQRCQLKAEQSAMKVS